MSHRQYIEKYGDDMPAIGGWTWGQAAALGFLRCAEIGDTRPTVVDHSKGTESNQLQKIGTLVPPAALHLALSKITNRHARRNRRLDR